MTGKERHRPAGEVEPRWQVRIDDTWVTVEFVIDTEAGDGTRYRLFVGSEGRGGRARLDDKVMSRPPEEGRDQK